MQPWNLRGIAITNTEISPTTRLTHHPPSYPTQPTAPSNQPHPHPSPSLAHLQHVQHVYGGARAGGVAHRVADKVHQPRHLAHACVVERRSVRCGCRMGACVVAGGGSGRLGRGVLLLLSATLQRPAPETTSPDNNSSPLQPLREPLQHPPPAVLMTKHHARWASASRDACSRQ